MKKGLNDMATEHEISFEFNKDKNRIVVKLDDKETLSIENKTTDDKQIFDSLNYEIGNTYTVIKPTESNDVLDPLVDLYESITAAINQMNLKTETETNSSDSK